MLKRKLERDIQEPVKMPVEMQVQFLVGVNYLASFWADTILCVHGKVLG